MDDIGSIIGIITGLAAVFTFVTGYRSLAEWRATWSQTQGRPTEPVFPVKGRYYIIFALFGALIAVTASAGLSGSDSGGITSLLLGLAFLLVIAFEMRLRKSVSGVFFGAIIVGVLAGSGFLFGSISHGEELFGLTTGLIIGVGCWLILLFGAATAGAEADTSLRTSKPAQEALTKENSAAAERAVLRIAAQQDGKVRISDIALNTEMTLDDAKQVLENLVAKGYAQKETTASGVVVYAILDLLAQ